MNIYVCIKKLYPNILDNEFKLQDDSDGRGVYIKQWTYAQPQTARAEKIFCG